MARVNIPVTAVTIAGVAEPAEVNGDATNHHQMANDGRTWLEARNSGASSRDVTISFTQTVDGQTITPRVVSIAAGATKKIGPFPTRKYGDLLLFTVSHAEVKLTGYRIA